MFKLNVIDGWLYFNHNESGRIYKMKTDGSGAEPYSEFPVDYSENYFIDTFGDYLFYTEFNYESQTTYADSGLYFDTEDNNSDQRFIYKISLDGKSSTQFSKQPVEGNFVSLEQDGFLYRTSDNNNYKILLDGTLENKSQGGTDIPVETSNSNEIKVTLDGETLAIEDQAPVEQNGSVLGKLTALIL